VLNQLRLLDVLLRAVCLYVTATKVGSMRALSLLLWLAQVSDQAGHTLTDGTKSLGARLVLLLLKCSLHYF
jgi:hypothetical protein